MKKVLQTLLLTCLTVLICTGSVWATSYEYSDATDYTTATHSTANWQRLGILWDAESSAKAVDTSDDGVKWSINGGSYGNDEITVGDTVKFQFTMYKLYWGQHNTDYLRFWIDLNDDGDFTDSSDLIETYSWVFTPQRDGSTASYANAYNYFYYTMTFTDDGEYWLRARVTCNESISYNLNNFTSTVSLSQGEVEDYLLTVNNRVPEPASLLLLGLGLMGLAGVRRKINK